MVLPSSDNSISFSQIQTEFGGTNPISLSEYYRGGGTVLNVAARSAANSGRRFTVSGSSGASNYSVTTNVNGSYTGSGWVNSGGYTGGQWASISHINYMSNTFSIGSNDNLVVSGNVVSSHSVCCDNGSQHSATCRVYIVSSNSAVGTYGVNPYGWPWTPHGTGGTHASKLVANNTVGSLSNGTHTVTTSFSNVDCSGVGFSGMTSARIWVFLSSYGKESSENAGAESSAGGALSSGTITSYTSTSTSSGSYSNPTWSYSEANGQSASGSISHNYNASQAAYQIQQAIAGVSGLSSGLNGTEITVNHETTDNNTGSTSVSNSGSAGNISFGSESHITGQTQHNGTQNIPSGSAEAGNPISMSNFYDMQSGS